MEKVDTGTSTANFCETPIEGKMRHIEFHVKEPEVPKEPVILHPDHPLLEKFQRALKQHLEMQIEQLSSQVFELESDAKKKEAAHQELGMETYEAQQIVAKQQAQLEACIAEYQSMSAAREQMEYELLEVEKNYKDSLNQLMEAERNEIHLRNEVESMNLLAHQLSHWEDNVESEIIINQRISEKTKKDKMKLMEEKRQQDMFIYALTTEVWRLEGEIKDMEMQIRVKEAEKEKLDETISQCNIDIEAFDTEYRCLLHAWNAVVIAIGNRDKTFATVKLELDGVNEKIRGIMNEIDQLRKMCQKEMETNEVLTMAKNRINREIKICQNHIDEENRKRHELEKQIGVQQTIIDHMNRDIEALTAENTRKTTLLNLETKEFDKINRKKVLLEEEIFNKLQDQLANDNNAKYVHKLLMRCREKNKDTEISLINNENSLSKLLMDTETQRIINEDLTKMLNDLKKEHEVLEAQVNRYSDDLKKCSATMNKKQTAMDIVTKKIEREMNKTGGVEVAIQEKKLLALEHSLEEIQEKNKQMEKIWLREQGHMIALSEQRQDQLQQLNMFRKQIMVLEQKNLKIGDEIDNLKKEQEHMNRNISKLRNQIVVNNEKIMKKRGNKMNLERSNEYLQQDYFSKLQDAEMECLQLQEMITNFEEEKQYLSEQLLELNRETLAWGKKFQIAMETKSNVHREQKQGGEIGNMKSEIHRMNIRYSQLKKAQEKLIEDLEHCVSRRDSIFTTSLAQEVRAKDGNKTYTKIAITRRLNNTQNIIIRTDKEIEAVKKKLADVESEEEQLKEKLQSIKEDEENYKENCKALTAEIETLKAEKNLQLELLVLKQKKLKIYTELAKGRKPYLLYKNEKTVDAAYNKQIVLNSQLQRVCEGLITGFPKYRNELQYFYNILRVHYLESL